VLNRPNETTLRAGRLPSIEALFARHLADLARRGDIQGSRGSRTFDESASSSNRGRLARLARQQQELSEISWRRGGNRANDERCPLAAD
jgi:hypothetical protein